MSRQYRKPRPRKSTATVTAGTCPLCGQKIQQGERIQRTRYAGEGATWEHRSCPQSFPVTVRRIGDPKPEPVTVPAGPSSCPSCHLDHAGECF